MPAHARKLPPRKKAAVAAPQFQEPGVEQRRPAAKKTAPKNASKSPHRHAQPAQTVEVTPPGLDPNKLMFDGKDTTGGPTFSVSEMCKIFFDRSDHWMRHYEKNLTFNGKPITIRRAENRFRAYDLGTIELMIHGFAQIHQISGEHAVHALTALNAIGKIYGFLESDD